MPDLKFLSEKKQERIMFDAKIENIHILENNSISELICKLVGTFNDNGVKYCHWKSNFMLSKALSGETDLDILIDRQSLSQGIEILSEFGFKLAVAIGETITPGIYHYYGIDSKTGELVHVHLFNSVITGESFLKSHLLPFETMLLENRQSISNIFVTSKEAELVLFIIRNFIKYGSLLDIVYLIKGRDEITDELDWLLKDVDISKPMQLFKKYCPVIDEQLFLKCIAILKNNGSLFKRILLARQMRRRLKVYAKYTSIERFRVYMGVLRRYYWQHFRGITKNKILYAGGVVIAIVGPEATGKSTMVTEIGRWLSKVFMVKIIHAGKPPSSWLTFPVNVVLPTIRNLIPQLRSVRLEGHLSPKKAAESLSQPKGPSLLVYAFRAVLLAWDRRQLLVKARRSAAKGKIIISDRYPSNIIGAVDSPRLEEKSNEKGILYFFYNKLARLESQLYQQIPPPDIVVKLKVSVDTAKQRNRDRYKPGKESDEFLESRHQQSSHWQIFTVNSIYEVDTEQPLEETIPFVKHAIWVAL